MGNLDPSDRKSWGPEAQVNNKDLGLIGTLLTLQYFRIWTAYKHQKKTFNSTEKQYCLSVGKKSMTTICIPHQATVQYLIPTVPLTLKIPYTWAFFSTESGFISAYRPEHRRSLCLRSSLRQKLLWEHLEGSDLRLGIYYCTLISWETWMALSAAGPSQVNHIPCDHVLLYEWWFTLFSQVLSDLILTVKLSQNLNRYIIPFLQMRNWFLGVQCSAQGSQGWFTENTDLLLLKAMLFHIISLTWRSWVSKLYIYKRYKLLHSDFDHYYKQ